MSEDNSPSPETGTRPTLLTICCILSFIAGLFRIIIYSIAFLFVSSGSVTINGEEQTTLDTVLVVIGMLLTLASLYGVVQMWKLQKKGFYFYSGASIISLIMITIGDSGFPFFTVAIGILFIVLFGVNLKHMK